MKRYLGEILCIVITLLFIFSCIPINAHHIAERTTIQNEKEIIQYNSGQWEQLIGNEAEGFGIPANMAIRGIEIYHDELYVGTQSLDKKSFFGPPDLEGIINNKLLLQNKPFIKLQSIIKARSLLDFTSGRTLKENNNKIFMFLLSRSVRVAMHMRTRISSGCELWKYNYSSDIWTQLIGNNPGSYHPAGFGDTKNFAASVIKKFKGKLYVGTWTTPRKGCEVWRYDGSNWEQLVGKNAETNGGFNDGDNIGAWCIEEFNDYLYIGTMNWGFTDKGGCQVWRSQDGTHWEKVVDRGFRDFLPENEQNVHNVYAWSAEVYQDQLYIGTFNTNTVFNFENCGCQLFRTSDGTNWEKVELQGGDGFGFKETYGIRGLLVYNDELYAATAAHLFQFNSPDVHGCEIWKYNGTESSWTEVIGRGKTNSMEKDGFGSKYNKYIWSMTVSSDNMLWVGTLSMQIIFKDKGTKGCEIYRYNGTSWTPIIKDNIGEMDNGFGYIYNDGARVMIEYPTGSRNIIVGTFKQVEPYKPSEGCEIWIRRC